MKRKSFVKSLRQGTALAAMSIMAAASALPAHADGKILTPEDLVELSEIGLKEAQEALTTIEYNSIYAITTLRSDDGDGATLKYYYGDPEERVFMTLFCHEHDPGELDCHEVGD